MYKTAWFCSSCEGELTDTQRMYSYGRCPLCGHKHERACTIVHTTDRAYKEVEVPSGEWYKPNNTVRVFN